MRSRPQENGSDHQEGLLVGLLDSRRCRYLMQIDSREEGVQERGCRVVGGKTGLMNESPSDFSLVGKTQKDTRKGCNILAGRRVVSHHSEGGLCIVIYDRPTCSVHFRIIPSGFF